MKRNTFGSSKSALEDDFSSSTPARKPSRMTRKANPRVCAAARASLYHAMVEVRIWFANLLLCMQLSDIMISEASTATNVVDSTSVEDNSDEEDEEEYDDGRGSPSPPLSQYPSVQTA